MLRNITTPIKKKRRITKESDQFSVQTLSQKYHRTPRQIKQYIKDVTIGKWDLVPGWKRGTQSSNNTSVAMDWLKQRDRIKECINDCTRVLQTKIPHWFLTEQLQQELLDNNVDFVSIGALSKALRRHTKNNKQVHYIFCLILFDTMRSNIPGKLTIVHIRKACGAIDPRVSFSMIQNYLAIEKISRFCEISGGSMIYQEITLRNVIK